MQTRPFRTSSPVTARKPVAALIYALLALAMLVLAAGARAQTADLQVLLQFGAFIDGATPQGALIQGADGNFYGTTSGGGTAGDYGTVFQITPTGVRTILHSFSASNSDGQFPYAGLTLGPDGNFYGTTESGGASNDGTVYSITPAGVLTTLHSFNGSDGQFPYAGLTLGTDGKFYGTTLAGGAGNAQGTVYTITTTGALTTLHSFTGSDGSALYASLVQGLDGNFYGTTFTGGPNGFGTVYSITPAGVLTTLHAFTGDDGRFPYANLIRDSVGNFYGITSSHNTAAGTAFSITPAGTLTTLHTFTGNEGSGLQSALVQGADGNFYGTTASSNAGGTGDGTVFQLTPAGVLTTLHVFNGLDGSSPQAALIQATDGAFYGVTRFGGSNDDGTVYSITSAGALTTLHNFSYVNATGAFPRAGLIQGSNGNFYGTTSFGGANGFGTISMLTPAGALTTLYSFTSTNSVGANADGALSRSSLVQGADGSLYGTTLGGGASGRGVVFRLTPGGILTTLHSFSGSPTDGDSPEAALVQGADGNFYGTTTSGGTAAAGTIFQITPAGALTIVHNFTGADGANPDAALVVGTDGNFYGTTSTGGAHNFGTVFSMTPAGALNTLFNFSGNDGANPQAPLVVGNGVFYGTTQNGGARNDGTVFSITPAGALTVLHSFTGTDGSSPQAALFLGRNGDFYGTTSTGGASGQGTVFSITPAGALTVLHSFNGADGSSPQAAVIQGSDGNFYSTTQSGGVNGTGTVFVLMSAPTITSALTASVQVNTPFTYQIAATNSPTSYNAAGLPAGLTFDPATGVISGTPTVAGVYAVTLAATNAVGTGTATLNLTVSTTAVTPPVITSVGAANAQAGAFFTYQIAATNSPIRFAAAGLPAALSVDPATGLILGVPGAVGTYAVTISASNSGGTGTATLTLTVGNTPVAPPVIASALAASVQVGAPFTYQITASNLPTSFGAAGLPANLSVDPATGIISGTVTAAGTYPVTISASNSGGTGTAVLTLTVSTTAVQPPVITSAASAVAQVNAAFAYQITATNTPTSFAATGLPAGLSVNPATGLISGTTAAVGNFSVALSATNAAGTGAASLTLLVSATPVVIPVITSAASETALIGQPFAYQIIATNLPTSYAATGLPAALTINTTTGLISGTPTAAAGTYPVTLSATNASGTGTASLSLILTTNSAQVLPVVTAVVLGDGMAIENGAAGKVAIRRTGDVSAPLTVRYKVKGSAVAGEDYKPLTGTVTIPAGAVKAKVKIKVINDNAHEGARVAKVKLAPSLDSTYTVGSPSTAKIKLIDND